MKSIVFDGTIFIFLVLLLTAILIFLFRNKVGYFITWPLRYFEFYKLRKKIVEYEKFAEYRLKEIDGINFKSMNFIKIIGMANLEELKMLSKILEADTVDATKLSKKLTFAGSNTWSYMFGSAATYNEIIDGIGESLNINFTGKSNYYDRELAILEKITSNMMERMDSKQKELFLKKLEEEAQKHGESYSGLLAGGGGLALAQASGFGVYLAASTAVGALTGALGVTLPFAFYTTMSSTIALFTGPLGVALLAGFGLSKLGAPNKKKTIPAVAVVALIRTRLEAERLEEARTIKKKLEKMKSEFRAKFPNKAL